MSASSPSALTSAYLPTTIPPHPRLMASDEDFARLRSQIHIDAVSGQIFRCLQQRADQLLEAPPLERVVIGRRLLQVSRLALSRISVLAMVARLTGETKYAKRAIAETLAMCRFTDWNPSHFLDVAEMALGVAIGYDWLYDDLSEAERTEIAAELLAKGIRASQVENTNWVRSHNNWNQVCHAGISAAAVALAELHPETAEEILRRAVESLPYSAKAYAPDGAYPEGPMYWSYGTTFHVILADVFQKFLGDTRGLDQYPGFAKSAEYITHMTAPSGDFFNYSDCRTTRGLALPLFWMAKQFDHPEWLRFDIAHLSEYLNNYDSDTRGEHYRVLAFLLLWWNPQTSQTPAPPLSWHAGGSGSVVAFRTSHDDPKALYVAMKGGGPTLSHAHMDAGAFILEADGVRWAKDLGMQEYESLESRGVNMWNGAQDGQRWKIFRLGPDCHNIIRFNHGPFAREGMAVLAGYCEEEGKRACVYDLSTLYFGVKSVAHGMMLIEEKAVLFQDEWTAGDEPVEITWQMLTPASASIQEDTILLSHEGESLRLKVLEPAGTEIRFTDVSLPREDYDAPNPGSGMITVTTKTAAGASGKLCLLAVPGSAGEITPPALRPLCEWISRL